MQAIWNGQVIADSKHTIVIESNHYFPADSLIKDFYKPSSYSTHCSWKGQASYYDICVNGDTNQAAAWYYPEALSKAKAIEGMVAFWRGVEISD